MATTLSYDYSTSHALKDVYDQVIKDQLQYFQYYNKKITSLEKGTRIKKDFYTKTTKEKVRGSLTITKLIPQEVFEMTVRYCEGTIVQRYTFFAQEENQTLITYSEENTFKNTRKTLNFNIISFPYRFLFKRQMKKRMQYIDSQLSLM